MTPETQKLHFYPETQFQSPPNQTQASSVIYPPVRTSSPQDSKPGYYRNVTPEKSSKSIHHNRSASASHSRSPSQSNVYSGQKIVITSSPNNLNDQGNQNAPFAHNAQTPAVMVKGIPVVAQSYKTVDMSLLNLRANFNTATPDKKEGVIEEFENANQNKKFYSINLTKFGNETDVNLIDTHLRRVLPDMIVARVGELGIKKFVMGGLAFTEVIKAESLDKSLFEVEEQSLRNPEVEKTILAALQNVMRTPSVDI